MGDDYVVHRVESVLGDALVARDDLARSLGVSVKTLDRMRKRQPLRSVKVGRRLYFAQREVDEWLGAIYLSGREAT